MKKSLIRETLLRLVLSFTFGMVQGFPKYHNRGIKKCNLKLNQVPSLKNRTAYTPCFIVASQSGQSDSSGKCLLFAKLCHPFSMSLSPQSPEKVRSYSYSEDIDLLDVTVAADLLV